MASSSSNQQWICDVFVNFRGVDIRLTFLSHLSSALSAVGVSAFIDDKELTRGEEIEPSLLGAIEGSRVSLVVLSRSYVSSSWCLKELVKIMECRKTFGQIVIPIFYEVDPSDVRHQRGAFQLEAIREHFLRWKTALTEVAGLSGHDSSKFSNEAELVKTIAEDVLRKIIDDTLPITEFPVGLDAQAKEVIEFIERQSSTVCVVGIWGMGGLGKTTTAKAIYNQIYRRFMVKSFIENIREVCENDSRGHIHLQEQLLYDVLKTKDNKIHSIGQGTAMIKRTLSQKRALVILDDVTKSEQLKALCGNREWFGSGSVIIVTTRDERLLSSLKADHVYRVKERDKDESLELFSWHAFEEASPTQDFSELSRSVAAYCGGLPLALEVLGSFLKKRTQQEWRSVLSKLERIPNDQVQAKLRISYDGLDELEKDIFLDICCFFIGKDRAYVIEILNGCGLHADIGITILIERSLLKVDKNNKIGMHDLLRDMGREIVRESSKKEPGKRSRLWSPKDAHDVLTNNTGTKNVEGLVLKMQRTGTVCFNANAFKEMKKLRLLQLVSVELAGDYGHLSKDLTWVYWRGCAFKYLPSDFYQGNLVVMDLKHSNIIQVWKEDKLLEKLKILNLSHSRYLKKTPDFSNLPNLEKLIMKDCPSLREIHQSIGELSNIVLINLKDCTSLSNLPRKFYELKTLITLNIEGCSKIERLEEDIGQMESLTALIAKDTAVKEVPHSILIMKGIAYISLCGYEGLSRDVFPSLTWSWLLSQKLTSQFHIIPSRPMSSLRCVRIQCGLEIQLRQLRRVIDDQYEVNISQSVTTSDSSQISNLAMRSLSIRMGSCHLVMDALGERIAQGLASSDSYNSFLPGDNYPSWLAYKGEGPSVNFEVSDDSDCCMKGITICVLYSSAPEIVATESLISISIINYTKLTIQIFKRDTVMSFNGEDWHGVISNLGPGDNVEIFVTFWHGMTVKETAVYLIYGESIAMEIEPSIIMEVEPSIKVKIEPSPQGKVLPLLNLKMEASSEVNVQESRNVEMEPSSEVNVHPSANVEMVSSPEVNVQLLANVEMEPSPKKIKISSQ